MASKKKKEPIKLIDTDIITEPELDLFDALRLDKYKVVYEAPIPTIFACECGKHFNASVMRPDKYFPRHCENCGIEIRQKIEDLIDRKKEQRKKNMQLENEMDEKFKRDALKYVRLTGHPKADKAYALAWQEGHSSGYSEVLSYLLRIAEVLKD